MGSLLIIAKPGLGPCGTCLCSLKRPVPISVKSGSSLDNSGQVWNDLQGGGIGRVLLQFGVVGRGSGDLLDSMIGS